MRILKLIKENGPFFFPYACVLVIVGLLQMMYGKTELFLFVNTHYTRQTDYFFKYLTYVGDGLFYAAIIIGLLFVQYRYALAAVLSFIITSLAAQGLKRLVFVDALRPSRFFENSNVHLRLIDGVQMYGSNSFPSGHATTAFSVFCLLTLLVKRKQWGYLFIVLAFWTSYSRVYLSQHFVEDVYFGSILGVSLTLITASWLFGYLEKNPKNWHQQGLRMRKNSSKTEAKTR